MGICYDVFFFDEFDWDYADDWNKDKTIAQVKAVYPEAELKGNLYGLLIFHVNKFFPYDFVGKVRMDSLKYRKDTELLTLIDIDLR